MAEVAVAAVVAVAGPAVAHPALAFASLVVAFFAEAQGHRLFRGSIQVAVASVLAFRSCMDPVYVLPCSALVLGTCSDLACRFQVHIRDQSN